MGQVRGRTREGLSIIQEKTSLAYHTLCYLTTSSKLVSEVKKYVISNAMMLVAIDKRFPLTVTTQRIVEYHIRSSRKHLQRNIVVVAEAITVRRERGSILLPHTQLNVNGPILPRSF